ncbi:alpha/beta hydrolase [Burkholderia plantarii]|uniref:alpha/beta hydrolase n=1 Tax=Burkholderia plantarii TaxID=41899 RepID=UPI00209AD2B0|nr:alpha/beta fold hydrolase [Burkholderia plantarii]
MSVKRIVMAGCLIAAGVYLAAAAALYLMQDRMLLPTTPGVADPRDLPHPGERIERWQIRGDYAGYVVTPDGPAPRGTVIVYHGNEESSETKLPLADVFVHAGYRVVIAEYPGHGRRAGPRTLHAALAASRDALAQTLASWPGEVWLVGESLGAGMAARVVQGNEQALAGVALITPWDTLASVAREQYPEFPVRWLLHDPFDSIAATAAYRGPLVIIGSQRDTLIPVAHAERLASAHPGSRLMLLPEANHDTWFDAMTAPRWQQVLRWMGAA